MPEISDEDLARYKRSIAESVEQLRKMREEIERQDQQIAATNRREEGWKNRVAGLEAELTRRGWPHHEGFESMQAEIDRQRGEIERLEIAVGDTEQLVKKANEARDLRRRVAELERQTETLTKDVVSKSDTIRSQTATIQSLQARLRVTEQFGGNPFSGGRARSAAHGSFRAGFFGVDFGGPPKSEPSITLPEGVELNDLLKLVHPDKHQNNEKANTITRWLLDVKRQKQQEEGP
jgi:hypothetical protein